MAAPVVSFSFAGSPTKIGQPHIFAFFRVSEQSDDASAGRRLISMTRRRMRSFMLLKVRQLGWIRFVIVCVGAVFVDCFCVWF